MHAEQLLILANKYCQPGHRIHATTPLQNSNVGDTISLVLRVIHHKPQREACSRILKSFPMLNNLWARPFDLTCTCFSSNINGMLFSNSNAIIYRENWVLLWATRTNNTIILSKLRQYSDYGCIATTHNGRRLIPLHNALNPRNAMWGASMEVILPIDNSITQKGLIFLEEILENISVLCGV